MEERELTLSQYFSVIKKNVYKLALWMLIAVIICSSAFLVARHFEKPSYSVSVQTKYELYTASGEDGTGTTSEKSDLVTYFQKNQNFLIKNTLEYFNSKNNVNQTEKEFDKSVSDLYKNLSVSQNSSNSYLFDISLKTFNSNSKATSQKILSSFILVLENSLNGNSLNHRYDDISNLATFKFDKYLGGDSSLYYNEAKEPLENLLDFYENILFFETLKTNACKSYSILDYTKKYGALSVSKINSYINNNILGNISTKGTLIYLLNKVATENISSVSSASYADYLTEYLSAMDKYGFKEKYDTLNSLDSQTNKYAYEKAVTEIEKNNPLNDIYLNNKYYIEVAINSNNSDTVALSEEDKESIVKLIENYNSLISSYNTILEDYGTDYTILDNASEIKTVKDLAIKDFVIFDAVAAVFAFIVGYVVYFIKLRNNGEFDVKEENK